MTTDSAAAVLGPHGELAELLTEVHPCGCLSTPDYGYLPCPACREAANVPVWGDDIDADFTELVLDSEGEVVLDENDAAETTDAIF